VTDEPASPRTIIVRPKAVADIEHQAGYLEDNARPAVAARFRTSIMAAIDQLAFMPGIGSPREAINPPTFRPAHGKCPGLPKLPAVLSHAGRKH